MSLPRGMAALEERLRMEQQDAEWSLLADVLEAVNEGGRNLRDVAAGLGVPRPTLEGWLRECGYKYETQRRLVAVQPVEVQ